MTEHEHDVIHLPENWSDWTVTRELGRGSFSVVYEAVRKDNSSVRCAIKKVSVPQDESEYDDLISQGFTAEVSKSFFDEVVRDYTHEIEIMEHFKGMQNIVSIEDYKVVPKEDGIGSNIYIRMEYLTSLERYLSDKTMSENEVIRLGIDICTALVFCRERNIIHRDIKPANIFVNDQLGTHVFYKLGDFGIARSLEGRTQGFSLKGTPNYMAPEVASGMAYNSTADIYSLGLTLYWLLNGCRLPFMPQTQIIHPAARKEALSRRLSGAPLEAPLYASKDMADIILKACSYQPDDRYQSAEEMKAALEGLLGIAPSVATGKKRADSTPKKPTSRKKAVRWVVLIILLFCIGVGTFVFIRLYQFSEIEKRYTSEDYRMEMSLRNQIQEEFLPLVDRLVPVHAVCEEEGIHIELISAAVRDKYALAVYSLKDLTYPFKVNKEVRAVLKNDIGSSEHTYSGVISFNNKEQTAYLFTATEFADADLKDRDILFHIDHMICCDIAVADLMPYMKEYGKATEGVFPPEPDANSRIRKILDPDQSLNIPIHKNTVLTGIGWLNGRLHVQMNADFSGGDGKYATPVRVECVPSDAGKRIYSRQLTWGDGNGDGHPEWFEWEFEWDTSSLWIDQISLTATITEDFDQLSGNWTFSVPLRTIRR